MEKDIKGTLVAISLFVSNKYIYSAPSKQMAQRPASSKHSSRENKKTVGEWRRDYKGVRG